MSIYKDCDIRGIYGKEFDESEIYRFGRALGKKISGKSITVAGDVRVSTPVIKEALIKGLSEAGTEIIDIGIVPTPVAYYAKKKLETYALAIVTASHNPAEYNGVKLMIGDVPPSPEEIKMLGEQAKNESDPEGKSPSESGGVYTNTSVQVLDSYFDTVCALVGKGGGKVVLDMGNGTTCKVAPEAFRRCGYDVVELYGEPDGRFPNRNPNPANFDNIKDLCEKVKAEKADFGVAFDGDGDRAVFVDDMGRPVINDKVLIFLFERAKSLENAGENPAAVYDQKCSQIVPKTIEKLGGKAILERSGHAFIKKRFLAEKAIIAGEISGHFFFKELGYDDGIYAGLTIGRFLKNQREKAGKSFSALADELPNPHITPDLRYKVAYGNIEPLLSRIKEDYKDNEISTYDGVRVNVNGGWFLVRRSVTEEAVTVKIEAESEEKLAQIKAELVSKYFN